MQLNFNNQKTQLTEQDVDSIIAVIGYRCRVRTINRLRSVLTYMPSQVKSYGILDRLMKEADGSWSYCAGQSYTDELKVVRECILG
jgi:hypothetical protein